MLEVLDVFNDQICIFSAWHIVFNSFVFYSVMSVMNMWLCFRPWYWWVLWNVLDRHLTKKYVYKMSFHLIKSLQCLFGLG